VQEEEFLKAGAMLPSQRGYRRGYAVAILLGLKEDQATLWKVYSHIVKPEKTVPLNGYRNDPKAVYNFHESIINALRPAMKEGVKSIVLASPPRTSFSGDFLRHVREHHSWLTSGASKAAFAEMTGSATTIHEVTVLTRMLDFKRIIGETTGEETENLLEVLEKRLNASSQEPLVLYSVEEIEDKVFSPWLPSKPKPEYILATDTYFAGSRQKNRIQKLTQIAMNRGVKTRVVNSKTAAGVRLLQLGGFVCILKLDRMDS
jgi:stalled ribosome rescue protein Dom34